MKKIFVFIMISVHFWSCINFIEEQPEEQGHMEGEGYFSIDQFFEDQWENRRGNPYTLLRISTLNDITDTSFVGLNDTLWNAITKPFISGDISEPKFYGQYKFSYFEDDKLDNINLLYETKDPDLYLQMMAVNIDLFTKKIKSIYMETRDKKRVYEKKQKLFYVPDRLIQIQEYEKSVAAPVKNIKIEYHYDY